MLGQPQLRSGSLAEQNNANFTFCEPRVVIHISEKTPKYAHFSPFIYLTSFIHDMFLTSDFSLSEGQDTNDTGIVRIVSPTRHPIDACGIL